MKTIEKEKLNQLLGIISPAPALRIAHFSEGGEEMIEQIEKFCSKEEYEYQINCVDHDFYEKINRKYSENNTVNPIKFTLNRPRYMMQGKLYEYLFVTANIAAEMQSDFLKKTHGIIKNAGLIFIFLPKEKSHERDMWLTLLEEHYYVASNTIDDLFEYYDVIISKKMHGWGG